MPASITGAPIGSSQDLYRDFVPLMSSGRVQLLDSDRLLAQLCGLERHVGPSGKDQINHPDKGHDDLINAAAGALLYANRDASDYVPIVTPWFTGKNCSPSDGDVATPVSAHKYVGALLLRQRWWQRRHQ